MPSKDSDLPADLQLASVTQLDALQTCDQEVAG